MDSGTIAFICVSAMLVAFMTPGLAFFYGGLGRRKNVINTMMMCILPMAVGSVLWFICGYSLSFAGTGRFIGNLTHVFLNGVSETSSSRGLNLPDLLFAAFQMMFSIIAVAIATGSVAERMRFTPLALFAVGYLLFIYYPFAHMVWGGGFLEELGTIDFAGGDVVHITSGVSGLVLAIVIGKRRDFERQAYRPHNVPFVLLGAGILLFGWYGFNAGSALSAGSTAVHALMTTHIAATSAMLSWIILEKVLNGKVSLVGASTGLVAGLVAITPGAGYVSVAASFIIGLLVSPLVYFFISVVKHKLGYDDALDAFGCHGIGGIFGGIVTAVFATPALAGGTDKAGLIYGQTHLFWVTLLAIVFTIAWTALVAYLLIVVIRWVMPLRVSDRVEAIGLDDNEHEETAYPTFMGLDS